jgi:hypothetical protein
MIRQAPFTWKDLRNMSQIYDRNKLLKLAAWAQMSPQKQAFVDPATAAGAMPPRAFSALV